MNLPAYTGCPDARERDTSQLKFACRRLSRRAPLVAGGFRSPAYAGTEGPSVKNAASRFIVSRLAVDAQLQSGSPKTSALSSMCWCSHENGRRRQGRRTTEHADLVRQVEGRAYGRARTSARRPCALRLHSSPAWAVYQPVRFTFIFVDDHARCGHVYVRRPTRSRRRSPPCVRGRMMETEPHTKERSIVW
jgi:hypothetical protein